MTIRNNDGNSVVGMSWKQIINGTSTIWLGVRDLVGAGKFVAKSMNLVYNLFA